MHFWDIEKNVQMFEQIPYCMVFNHFNDTVVQKWNPEDLGPCSFVKKIDMYVSKVWFSVLGF